jgi:hypothetical protein
VLLHAPFIFHLRVSVLVSLLALLAFGSTASAQPVYVDANSARPTPPYTNWATAARVIQDAVNAASPGDEIIVTNGVYQTGTAMANGTNRVALANVELRSVNGPQMTVIDGALSVRGVYVGTNAVLNGFTVRNGRAWGMYGLTNPPPPRYGGAVLSEPSGIITNCILTGNSATGLVFTMVDCCPPTAWDWFPVRMDGGGAFGGRLYNCILSGNSGGYGGGAYRATLYHCVVTGNDGDGGVDESTLYNCIVRFNRGGDWRGSTFSFSCTTPLPGGLGNIEADPLFVNAAAGDYRLRPDSPCIDAGTNLTGLITTDLDGLPRPLDGNGDGIAQFDMGAYEYNPYHFEPTLHFDASGFAFTVVGEPGKSVRVEHSRDLVQWELVATLVLPATGQRLIDPPATSELSRFYRAVSVP